MPGDEAYASASEQAGLADEALDRAVGESTNGEAGEREHDEEESTSSQASG
jgi:hypothetical protein